MDIGMLWFDNDKDKSISQKVIEAATYYRDKYNQVPNCCAIGPLEDLPTRVGRIRIVADTSIIPHHFWLGIDAQN